jgi:hypothetical protein
MYSRTGETGRFKRNKIVKHDGKMKNIRLRRSEPRWVFPVATGRAVDKCQS